MEEMGQFYNPMGSWLTETENGFMEPKFPLRFVSVDEGHPFIIWRFCVWIVRAITTFQISSHFLTMIMGERSLKVGVRHLLDDDKLPNKKLTWFWLEHSTMNEKMYFLLNMWIFQCDVSFQGSKPYEKIRETRQNHLTKDDGCTSRDRRFVSRDLFFFLGGGGGAVVCACCFFIGENNFWITVFELT